MDLDKRSKIITLTGVSNNTITHVEAQKLAGIKKNNVKIKKEVCKRLVLPLIVEKNLLNIRPDLSPYRPRILPGLCGTLLLPCRGHYIDWSRRVYELPKKC